MGRIYRISLCAIGLFFLSFSCFAGGTDSDSPLLNSIKSFFSESKLECLLAVSLGYDDNVHLDSRRISDGFTQIIFNPTLTAQLNDNLERKFGYELLSLIYMDEANLNLIRNGLNYALNYKINEDLNFSSEYRFGMTDYPNTGEDDFLDHTLELKIKQKLPLKIYHSLGYEFIYKAYTQRQVKTTATIRSHKERKDKINTIEYEIGKYFSKDLLKINFKYDYNDSNDTYLKYYDYDSYKPTISLTHLFSDKIFCYTSFSEQWRDYRSRTLSRDGTMRERDRTEVSTLGLFYNLKKGLTVGVNYIYRQNYSNEPVENYSSSTISLNTYYTF